MLSSGSISRRFNGRLQESPQEFCALPACFLKTMWSLGFDLVRMHSEGRIADNPENYAVNGYRDSGAIPRGAATSGYAPFADAQLSIRLQHSEMPVWQQKLRVMDNRFHQGGPFQQGCCYQNLGC